MSDLVLYISENDVTRFDLRVQHGTAWPTQLEFAELFQITNLRIQWDLLQKKEERLLDSIANCSRLFITLKTFRRRQERIC